MYTGYTNVVLAVNQNTSIVVSSTSYTINNESPDITLPSFLSFLYKKKNDWPGNTIGQSTVQTWGPIVSKSNLKISILLPFKENFSENRPLQKNSFSSGFRICRKSKKLRDF